MKPRGGEGQNGRLKCPLGFLVFHINWQLLQSLISKWQLARDASNIEGASRISIFECFSVDGENAAKAMV